MNSTVENGEEIVLEIEEERLTCKKSILVEHSDYFRVMFEGAFVERNQATIKLQDVDAKSFTIILNLITDTKYLIRNDDILLVLQTACMLQFHKIQSMCTERITEILDVNTCLKIWHTAELLDLTPLYLKAKSLSLMEFDCIKDTDCLLELNIQQLHDYLANVFLIVKSEVDVFRSCMKWWHKNSSKKRFRLNFSDTSKLFYYFLSFLDFKALSNDDIKEILTTPGIETDKEIICILNNIIDKRNGIYVDDKISSKENILLNGRRRIENKYPFVIINDGILSSHFFLLSTINSNFQRIMRIPPKKIGNNPRFHIWGYKQFIFLLCGTFIGKRGNNFWAYNTITERWERKPDMPFQSGCYESYMADDIIYIVTSDPPWNNMYHYDCKLNEWSKSISLPSRREELSCCVHKNSLFVMNFMRHRGYIFNLSRNSWIEFNICDTHSLDVRSNYKTEFVFSYEDCIYIKDKGYITQMKFMDNQLEVIRVTYADRSDSTHIPCVVCNGFLHTIHHLRVGGSSLMAFDKLDLSNCSSEVIVEYDVQTPFGEVMLCGKLYRFNMLTQLCSLSSYSMVKESNYMTDVLM